MAKTTDGRPSNKVARLLDEYGLEGLGAELEARWAGDGHERMSLRDLAEYFNKRLLECALIDAGMKALESDVNATYSDLMDDNTSVGVRTDTENRLEQNGIDVDSLERDFVTYQAIRSYLKEYRGAEYQQLTDEEKIEKDLEIIRRLLTRTLSVTEDRIEKLRGTERIAVEEFEVLLDMHILCQSCGTQYSATQFLEERGCECQRTE